MTLSRLLVTVLTVFAVSAPAAAQTPDRPSPFAPSGEPAADQYTSPAAAAASSGGAPPTASSASRSTAPDAGLLSIARESRGRRAVQPRPVRVTPPTAVRGAVATDQPGGGGGSLPFTGAGLELLLLVALGLLGAGVGLRRYGRRSAGAKPAGSRIRGWS